MLKIGDKVCFKTSVVKRVQGDVTTAGMRGVVVEIVCDGKVARVDCGNTFTSEDGRTIRGIPVANLTKFLSNGAIPDWT